MSSFLSDQTLSQVELDGVALLREKINLVVNSSSNFNNNNDILPGIIHSRYHNHSHNY
jgi:hypothetical protein